MGANRNGGDGRLMMIPFEVWQEMECNRIGITTEQHNRVLELADKIKVKGMGDQYDVLIRVIMKPAEDLSGAKTFKGVFRV